MIEKTYDALILPTGETTFGDYSFPVSSVAADLFKSGKFGCIFVTGGHGGFSKVKLGETVSEAEETNNFLRSRDISENQIYWDGQSLDTLGNFTFPIVEKLGRNPSFLDFKEMLVIGQKGHLWRIRDCVGKVISSDRLVDFYAVPGEHNNNFITKIYHQGLMNALREIKSPSPDDCHEFLLNNHPFYSKGWYDKSFLARKIEGSVKVLDWYLK